MWTMVQTSWAGPTWSSHWFDQVYHLVWYTGRTYIDQWIVGLTRSMIGMLRVAVHTSGTVDAKSRERSAN